jgi:hypothetical protein
MVVSCVTAESEGGFRECDCRDLSENPTLARKPDGARASTTRGSNLRGGDPAVPQAALENTWEEALLPALGTTGIGHEIARRVTGESGIQC